MPRPDPDPEFPAVVLIDTREREKGRRLSPKERSAVVRQWMADNQARHLCGCGCGVFIVIQIHHSARGIPRFIDGHAARVDNPMKGRTRERNPNYKGGRYVGEDGYVYILDPGRRSFNYTQEHRLIMARHLGRELGPDEVVHHRNRIKSDNRLENLQLMTNAEHSALHAAAGEVGFTHHQNWGRRDG